MKTSIPMRDIAGKIIIITGASSGIGRATALALAREPAQLVLVARRHDRLAALEEEIRKAGGIATSMVLDLRQKDQVETMIRSTRDRFGRIDVLINNAGFGFLGSVEKTPAAVVREIFDLNFEAVDPLKLIAELKSSAETKSVSLLGYLSHLQSELKVQAQDAGCDMVLARSAFSQNMLMIFKRHAGIGGFCD